MGIYEKDNRSKANRLKMEKSRSCGSRFRGLVRGLLFLLRRRSEGFVLERELAIARSEADAMVEKVKQKDFIIRHLKAEIAQITMKTAVEQKSDEGTSMERYTRLFGSDCVYVEEVF